MNELKYRYCSMAAEKRLYTAVAIRRSRKKMITGALFAKTRDILKSLGQQKKGQIIGFALKPQ
jgi:hypothetical protein